MLEWLWDRSKKTKEEKERDKEITENLAELQEIVHQGYIDFLQKTCEDMTEEGHSREHIETAISKMKVDLKSVVDDDGNLTIEFSWK